MQLSLAGEDRGQIPAGTHILGTAHTARDLEAGFEVVEALPLAEREACNADVVQHVRAHLVAAQFLRQRERRSTKGHGTFVLVAEHREAPEVREHAQLGALVRHALGQPLGRDEVLARARLVAPQPAVFAQHHLRSGGIVHVAGKQHLASAT